MIKETEDIFRHVMSVLNSSYVGFAVDGDMLAKLGVSGYSGKLEMVNFVSDAFQGWGVDFRRSVAVIHKNISGKKVVLSPKVTTMEIEKYCEEKNISFVVKDTGIVVQRKDLGNVVDPDYFWFDPSILPVLEYSLLSKKTMYLYGDAGCGKTEIIERTCEKLGIKYESISLNGEISIDDFLGFWTIINRESIFVEGILPQCMRQGKVLIINEFDGAPPDILFVLHDVLAGKPLRITKANIVVEPHDRFNVIATANTIGRGDDTSMYQGTYTQNEATYDRWVSVVKMGYPPKAEETAIISKRISGIDTDTAIKISTLANNCRNGKNMFSTFSVRKSLSLAESFRVFTNWNYALKISVYDRICVEDRKVVREHAQRVFGDIIK
jgi:hypothetical protein